MYIIPRSFIPALLFVMAALTASYTNSFATSWTTTAAGDVANLSLWTNGTAAPTTFATPGDTWTIIHPMTLTSTSTWTLGTPSTAPVTLNLSAGGAVSFPYFPLGTTAEVHGNCNLNGGTVSVMPGASGHLNVMNNCSMSAGSVNNAALSSTMDLGVYGNFTMTGGSANASAGALAIAITGTFNMSGGSVNATTGGVTTVTTFGDCILSGTAAMTSDGSGGSYSLLNIAGSSSGPSHISNSSTGVWTNTDVHIGNAVLAGNFSTTTGGATNGVVVNGVLECPVGFQFNGTGIFNFAAGTLIVASPAGINGAVTTTGIKTFAADANYTYNGTVPQVTGTFLPSPMFSTSYVITINNPAGVTLSQPLHTEGTVAFLAGTLSTGPYTLNLSWAPTAITGAGPLSYVKGTLYKRATIFFDMDFEVGDASYTPVHLRLTSTVSSGGFSVIAHSGIHPMAATSQLTTANMASGYWTINNYVSGWPVTPTVTYNASDVIGGSNSSFKTQFYEGGSWLLAPISSTNTATPFTSKPSADFTGSGDYIFGNQCATAPISGVPALCQAAILAFTNATPGGTWSSSTPTVATVSATGDVTGVSPGTAVISYTASGCLAVKMITINPLPNAGTITGQTFGCMGSNIHIGNPASGGVWSSSNPSVATVSVTGMVTPVSPGTTVISYAVTNSCGTDVATHAVEVFPADACPLSVKTTGTATPVVQIHPNPSSGQFSLQLVPAVAGWVQVTDVMGRMVAQRAIAGNATAHITLAQPPGIYFVALLTEQGLHTAKVIVR